MAYQPLEKTEIPAYILILVVMSHELIEQHGLRVLFPVHHVYAFQIKRLLR